MSESDLDVSKRAAVEWFDALQTRIMESFESLERREDAIWAEKHAAPGKFTRTPWERTNHDGQPGGGGRMGILKDRVFEKAGVHVSTVFGTFAPEFAAQIPGAGEDPPGAGCAEGEADGSVPGVSPGCELAVGVGPGPPVDPGLERVGVGAGTDPGPRKSARDSSTVFMPGAETCALRMPGTAVAVKVTCARRAE